MDLKQRVSRNELVVSFDICDSIQNELINFNNWFFELCSCFEDCLQKTEVSYD